MNLVAKPSFSLTVRYMPSTSVLLSHRMNVLSSADFSFRLVSSAQQVLSTPLRRCSMSYSDDAVRAKLSALSETQDSIVTVAQWVLFHRYIPRLSAPPF